MIVEGFVGKSPEGRTRVFLRNASDRFFVDVDEDRVRDTTLVEDPDSPLAVWAVELDDETTLDEGRLDEAEFEALFAWVGESTADCGRTHETRPGTTCSVHDPDTRMGICI